MTQVSVKNLLLFFMKVIINVYCGKGMTERSPRLETGRRREHELRNKRLLQWWTSCVM